MRVLQYFDEFVHCQMNEFEGMSRRKALQNTEAPSFSPFITFYNFFLYDKWSKSYRKFSIRDQTFLARLLS